MTTRTIARLLGVLAFASPTALPAAPKQKSAVAIMDLVSENAGPVAALTDVLTAEIGRCGYKVVSKNDIMAMLDMERMKDITGCSDVSCMAEIGGALGVSYMVSGAVAKVGESYLVSIKLVNTDHASVENRVTMKWAGDPLGLTTVVAAAAQELMLDVSEKKKAPLMLPGLTPKATVFVDDKPAAPTGQPAAVPDLEIGPHTLKITADDHHELSTAFVIKSGEPAHVDGALAAIPHPIYTRWWFWTLIVGVVAAGVVIPVVLTRGDEPSASGQLTVPDIFSQRFTIGGSR